MKKYNKTPKFTPAAKSAAGRLTLCFNHPKAGNMSKAMKIKYYIFLSIFFSCCAMAEEEPRPIDVSQCVNKDCYAQDVHELSPLDGIKVQAWFDLVRFEDDEAYSFFPLFNVFNTSGDVKIYSVGMQLLDEKFNILSEAIGTKEFGPVSSNTIEPNNDTFFSVGADSLTSEIILKVKYIKVVFRQ